MDPRWIPTSRPGLEPTPAPPETLESRLRGALNLHETGRRLMRQNLRRLHPEFSESQLTEALRAWLWTRPGAEWGDGVGRPRAL